MTSPYFEISDRFRLAVEKRIARLEQGAAHDTDQLAQITCDDHRKRQRQLINTQIEIAVQLRARLSFTGAIPADFILSSTCLAER